MNQFQVQRKPHYREVYRGVCISAKDYEVIKRISSQIYQSGNKMTSKNYIDEIKKNLGGEWFGFIVPAEEGQYDYSFTDENQNNFVSFIIDNTKFQLCRIKSL